MVTPEQDLDLHYRDLYPGGGCSPCATLMVNYLCTPAEQQFCLAAPKCRQSQMPKVHLCSAFQVTVCFDEAEQKWKHTKNNK